MSPRIAGVLIILLIATAAAPAQTSAPSAKPSVATGPTTALADPSTPKGALKALAQALDAGERKAVLDLLAAKSSAERKTADATADLAEAAAALRRAAAKCFGQQAARPLGAQPGATQEALDRIDAAKVQIDGDRATVRTETSEGPPMVLERSAGAWRVPVSELCKDTEPAELDRNVAALAEQSRLLRELAAEVAAGKYKTAPEARQALDKRIMQSALPTQPATRATP